MKFHHGCYKANHECEWGSFHRYVRFSSLEGKPAIIVITGQNTWDFGMNKYGGLCAGGEHVKVNPCIDHRARE